MERALNGFEILFRSGSSSGNPFIYAWYRLRFKRKNGGIFKDDAATILLSHVASNADVFTSSWHHVVFVDNNGSYRSMSTGLPVETG